MFECHRCAGERPAGAVASTGGRSRRDFTTRALRASALVACWRAGPDKRSRYGRRKNLRSGHSSVSGPVWEWRTDTRPRDSASATTSPAGGTCRCTTTFWSASHVAVPARCRRSRGHASNAPGCLTLTRSRSSMPLHARLRSLLRRPGGCPAPTGSPNRWSWERRTRWRTSPPRHNRRRHLRRHRRAELHLLHIVAPGGGSASARTHARASGPWYPLAVRRVLLAAALCVGPGVACAAAPLTSPSPRSRPCHCDPTRWTARSPS